MTTDLTPEHAARNQGDDKGLHPEVLAAYRYVERVLDSADVPSSKLGGPLWFGWALREAFLAGCSHSARAALSQPEPVGPTDEELKAAYWEAFVEAAPCGADESWLAGLRAVARWGRPVITPIPVSERLPGAEDCDVDGFCWFWDLEWSRWQPGQQDQSCTHWLPATALPLPTPTP
jgi:hypothetical protein